jgi:hypothetical protein
LEARIKYILSIALFALVAGGVAGAAGPSQESFVGINNRTIDGWANVASYVGDARVLTFCVGPGQSKQEAVRGQFVTRVSVAISRGEGCKGTIDGTRDLPVHMKSALSAGALGFLDGNRGSYVVKDRL